MNTLVPISLNEDWRYHFTDKSGVDYSALVVDEARWIPLSRLEDWAVGAGQGGADWFRKTVVIEPVGECVNYLLRLLDVPETVTVYVNGREIGTVNASKAHSFDVTHAVSLGENVIALRLTCASGAGGGFGGVELLPVPCDPDTDLQPGTSH